MVTRNQSASQGRRETNTESSMIDEFVIKLAQALQRRGKRTWKAKEASKAVEQAISSLPNSTLKSSLQASLSETAAKLLHHLQPQEEAQTKKQTKRAKPASEPAKAFTQQKKRKQSRQSFSAAAAVHEAPTLLDSSLEAAVAAILSSKTPKSYKNVAIAPLISRFPPPEGLVEWHLLRSIPDAAVEDDWTAQILSAEKALQICNALATQAPSSEHALAVFESALAQMLKAVEALEAATIIGAGQDGAGGSDSGQKDIASGWEHLKLLSNRAVICMQLAAKEISTVNSQIEDHHRVAGGGSDVDAERNTRWWLSWNSHTRNTISDTNEKDGSLTDSGPNRRSREQQHSDDVVTHMARTACSVAVSICTVARLRATGGENLSVEVLAAHASHDMKILAPYAAVGQVMAAAEAVLEEVNKTNDDAMLFLALYMAAVEESSVIQGEHYFLHMLAARNASVAATSLGDAAGAARILSRAAYAPPPPLALEWLRDQPPSSVILQALESLQRGPQGLSAHLVYDAPERAVKALAAAAKAGGVLAISNGGGADGDADQEPRPADDLLFFVSKEGDGGAFGRDWGNDDDDDESDGEDGDAGLTIDDLPDEGKSMSEEEEYSDESEDDD